MDSATIDHQFLAISMLGIWMGVRLIVSLIGWLAWSPWLALAVFAELMAFSLWLRNLEYYP